MERLIWICLGGAAGTGVRYLIALWAARRFGSTFPYGTLIVNLAGCFAITVVMHAALTLAWSRREGFAGATVIHGVAGFGASSVIHTARLLELSTDLPVLIEVVDDDAHIERLLPILDEMVTGGALVTVERVRVVKYAAGPGRRPREA
jgi:hypothetical protein